MFDLFFTNLISNTFPFVVGQDFREFVDNNIWYLVNWYFDKLIILGCIFSRDVF